MSNNSRVSNLTRRFSLKHSQAAKAVEACACVWVEYGVSIRDLTLAESILARNEQARLREALPLAELPGLLFRPPSYESLTTQRELVAQANALVAHG